DAVAVGAVLPVFAILAVLNDELGAVGALDGRGAVAEIDDGAVTGSPICVQLAPARCAARVRDAQAQRYTGERSRPSLHERWQGGFRHHPDLRSPTRASNGRNPMLTREQAQQAIYQIRDPELDRPLGDLDMIEELRVLEDGKVSLKIALRS